MTELLWSLASLAMAFAAAIVGVALVRTYRAGPAAIRKARLEKRA